MHDIDMKALRDATVAALRAEPALAALWQAGRRPRVGVSACLAGERVRYDGDHRRSDVVTAVLAALLDLVPLCPEMAIGLGVPRPTIERVRLADGRERVRGVDNPGLDATDALDAYARQVAGNGVLHGYVFKARSPSCAPGSAPVFDGQGAQVDTGWGRYAAGVRAALPAIPVCDEETLLVPAQATAFVVACYRQAAREKPARD